MLQRVVATHFYSKAGLGYFNYTYHIYDSTFDQYVKFTLPRSESVEIIGRALNHSTEGIIALIKCYQSRNMPVAPELARFYLIAKEKGYDIQRCINNDYHWMSRNSPEHLKYFACVENQIKRIEFVESVR